MFLIGLSALATGCGAPPNFDRYTPSADRARQALEQALQIWQNDGEGGERNSVSPRIQVVDTQRQSGQTLERFEIQGEVPTQAGRCYAVRLHLRDPDAQERVRFVVLGIDPLWVFRQEDFDMLAHWEHVMTSETPPPDEPEVEGTEAGQTALESPTPSKE
ncbi:MAG: hypothetical protein ACKV0T_03145 [Planctomycetales bacterium]